MTDLQRQAVRDSLEVELIIETIQENFNPQEVFSEEQLTEWAEENGFKKED